ncbi:hypothetical protein D8911_11585 [Levilactobacillus brevis]|nr:hypothetical protein D8911_11585 [Levilactobacillus brevis]
MHKYLIVNEFRRPELYPYTRTVTVEAATVEEALSRLSAYELTSDTRLAKAVRAGVATEETRAVYELKSDKNLLEEL